MANVNKAGLSEGSRTIGPTLPVSVVSTGQGVPSPPSRPSTSTRGQCAVWPVASGGEPSDRLIWLNELPRPGIIWDYFHKVKVNPTIKLEYIV